MPKILNMKAIFLKLSFNKTDKSLAIFAWKNINKLITSECLDNTFYMVNDVALNLVKVNQLV